VEEISGGPGWVSSDLFDVAAKLNGPTTYPQFQLMLQSLLEERFRLHIRRDTGETQVFALVVARGGPRMTEVESPSPGVKQGYRNGLFISPAIGMAALAANLSLFVGREVIDETGLTARYDVRLQWTPDENQFALLRARGIPETSPNAPPPDPLGPSLFTALREQLGLSLVSTRRPTELVVIDGIVRPSEN